MDIDDSEAITVRCEEPSHKPVTIAGFMPFDVLPGRTTWSDYTRMVPGVRRNVEVQTRPIDGEPGVGARRWNFRCSRCGASVTTREERLYPILDTLRTHGVSSITIRRLIAILGSS